MENKSSWKNTDFNALTCIDTDSNLVELIVHEKMTEFNVLTCIDTASSLVELIRIDNKTAEHTRSQICAILANKTSTSN